MRLTRAPFVLVLVVVAALSAQTVPARPAAGRSAVK